MAAGNTRGCGFLVSLIETTLPGAVHARIATARACIADGVAVNRLLHDVPEADQIRAGIAGPYLTLRWQQSSGRSFWISSDGSMAVCLTVSGLEVDEMVAVWLSFDDCRRRQGFTLTAQSLRALIESELGVCVAIED